MRLNRRKFAIGTAALTTGGLAFGKSGFVLEARAALDNEELMKPGPLGDQSVGPEDAPVTIIEYASMTCPHCANFHINTYPQIKEKFIDTGKVRLIFREFPFDDLALAAFMLARCAGDKKYFPMIDVLFEKQAVWTSRDNNAADELFKIARFAGFTEESFNACLSNKEIAAGVHAVKDRAALKFGVRSTPTFFINGEEFKGNQTIEKFEEAINGLTN
ncbi:MAG: DsbA family protein [Hyphomicrobiales bacterium]